MDLSNVSLKEIELGHLLFSILLLLCSSHFFGYLFNKLLLPPVVGEIFGGILLGPSFLGLLSPDYYQSLFNGFPGQVRVLSFLYWMGLILLMLTAGFKINHTSKFEDKKTTLNLIIFSTIIPLLGGIIFYKLFDFHPYIGLAGSEHSMAIIVCISVAITSIPVISKIFIDLNILESRFAKIVLMAAIFHDLILWIGLDIAIHESNAKAFNPLLDTFITLLFLSGAILLAPFLTKNIARIKEDLLPKSLAMGFMLSLFLSIITVANFLKINIVFSSLIAGMIIGMLPNNHFISSRNAVSEFSLAFFVPIYFALVGLKINLPLHFDLQLFLVFLIISSLLEVSAVAIGMQFLKKDWLSSLNFGLAMNARGGPGIVIASIAYDASIINETFFVVLILVAIVTSLITGLWFRLILKQGWELCKIA